MWPTKTAVPSSLPIPPLWRNSTGVELPAKPHDLAVDAVGSVWFTLIGNDHLGRGCPKAARRMISLPLPIVGSGTRTGDRDVISVYDPITGSMEEAAADVVEPRHSAVDTGGGI